MKVITITGPWPQAKNLARQRYTERTAIGLHAILDAPGDLRNSLPERSMSAADVLITARVAEAPISETTTD